ncbi:hypothetical protein [Mycobacteroides abscessus]|uniref:hypothetical protein n=1 Tax=Mycobacteroides abscessus TaxID=36809 RepID=UPI0013001305|nr:hypothetical protein [Mycobacteroides abscessus]
MTEKNSGPQEAVRGVVEAIQFNIARPPGEQRHHRVWGSGVRQEMQIKPSKAAPRATN